MTINGITQIRRVRGIEQIDDLATYPHVGWLHCL